MGKQFKDDKMKKIVIINKEKWGIQDKKETILHINFKLCSEVTLKWIKLRYLDTVELNTRCIMMLV